MSRADPPVENISDDDARLQHAADWLLRLREEPTNGELIGAWLKWCNADPRNGQAFKAIEEVWMLAGNDAARSRPTAQQLRAEIDVEISTAGARRWWRYAVAMAAVLVVGIAAWRSELFVRPQVTEYATAVAVERAVALADGSQLTLGGASTVRVNYSRARRDLELLRGEAHFDVQHDTRRPFVVQAQHVAVTAVGTAFDVRADAARTVINVTAGVVDIRLDAARVNGAHSSFKASAGQQVSLDMHGAALAVHLYDAPHGNEWRDGMLSFVDEPLRSVVARVNRYSSRTIVLDATAGGRNATDIASLRFTGTVFRNRIDDWAASLVNIFPIETERAADGTIRLRAR